MLGSKERGEEAWLAAEVEEEEVIEDNPPFQHPLILPQLFLFRCLAVLDVSVSARKEEDEREKKKACISHNLPFNRCLRAATPRVWKPHLGEPSARFPRQHRRRSRH